MRSFFINFPQVQLPLIVLEFFTRLHHLLRQFLLIKFQRPHLPIKFPIDLCLQFAFEHVKKMTNLPFI